MSGAPGSSDGLVISDLHVGYAGGIRAVRGVDLHLTPGGCLSVVGESGCGKSTVAMAVLGLLPPTARVTGSIRLGGCEVVGASERQLRQLRGLAVGLVAQDPVRSFNPLLSVGASVAEAWRVHERRPAVGEVVAGLSALGIPDGRRRARQRPHQWSGGMLQRAAICAASAHTPSVIVADEPTSALDADRADAVIGALCDTGAGVLLISHDLALVARHSDTVAVMYAGRIVELGPSAQVLQTPRHPYTQALLAATPRPGSGLPVPLPGAPPPLDAGLPGCAFAARCRLAIPACAERPPQLLDGVACYLGPNAPAGGGARS
jgi:peptide/nickel transport system ATP-binding protein